MSFNFLDFAAAQTAGKQINADLQSRRDESALKQQTMQMSKLAMAQQQLQQQQQADFQQRQQQIITENDERLAAAKTADGQSPDTAAEQQLQQHVDLYSKLGDAALRSGQTTAASEYMKLSDVAQGKLDSQKKLNLDIADKQTKQAAAFAGSVLNGSVPPEQAFEWVKDNVGLKAALEIPADPEKAKLYWKAKQTQGLTAADQINNEIKVQEFTTREKRAAQEHADLQADRTIRRQELAVSREAAKDFKQANLDLKREGMDLRQKQYEEGGAIQRRQTIAAVNYANEAARGLDLVATMGAGQTANIFGHLQDGTTILKALEKTGTNKMTPEMQQIYQTATKGLGLELAQLATAGSGRAPVKDLIAEMGSMVEARPGDKEYEIMFKLANAADFAKVRLEAVPASPDPKIQAIRERAEKALERYPHPKEIIALANKQGIKLGKAQTFTESMRKKMDRLLGGVDGQASNTHSGDEAGAPAASGHPSDISDLLNKYKN